MVNFFKKLNRILKDRKNEKYVKMAKIYSNSLIMNPQRLSDPRINRSKLYVNKL